jgi:glycosyltransferase involved in cell wall biosynthesis
MKNFDNKIKQKGFYKYSNLQIGDNDLVGNKFNGHDLHIALRDIGVDSAHLVWNKESNDKNTYVIAGEKKDRVAIRSYNEYLQHLYDLDNVHNPLIYDIIYNKLFLDADVIHLHLMHNGLWDLNLLPIMSKLKPIIWTVHDMWIATGDTRAAERPDYFFPLLSDVKNIDFNWELKKEAIKNSNVTFVVASKYMEKAMKEYSLFKEKGVVYIPFGLNFDIFYPRNKTKTREELGLDLSEKIILVRGDVRAKKGLDYIEYVMDKLGSKYELHFLIVGPSELIVPNSIKTTYYGWVKDDELMAKLYSVADLFLMPSTREYFGMMAIESMACGTLPIVLNGTALPDTVNAPSCGVSTRQDMKEYSEAVDYYLNSSKVRTKKEKKCIDYVKDKHDKEKYLNSLDNLYSSVIKGHVKDGNYNQILKKLKAINEIKPRLKAVSPNISDSDFGKYQEKNLFFDSTVWPLKDEIARLVADNNAIRAENDIIRADNVRLGNDIQSIYNSKRWKVTGGLAKLLRKIKK